MNDFASNVLVALLVLSALAGLAMVYRHFRASASERRMRAMMLRLGLDPEMDFGDDLDALAHAVRRRCRKCQTVDECEAWLESGSTGGNEFCPNARVFEILSTSTKQSG